jgi:hypothetical protein
LIADWQQLAKASPYPVYQGALAASLARLATLQAQTGEPARALTSLDQAVALLKAATARQPDDCVLRQALARVHAEQARLLAPSDAVKALQSARQAVDVSQKLAADEPAYLYDLACHRALLSSMLDPKAAEAERQAAAAMDALSKAVAAGCDNVHDLKTTPSLAPLRSRSDFPRLLQQAEANAKQGER